MLYLSAVLTLIICEVLLRITGIYASHYEKTSGYYQLIHQEEVRDYHVRKPNSVITLSSPEFNYIRTTNSLGLSDKEPEISKEGNDFLTIVLGDSFTEGEGAPEDSTWVKFLERKFDCNDSINYRFINAGICGSDPFYQYKLLHDKLLKYKPNLVITAFGYDLNDIILFGGMERFEKRNRNNIQKTKALEYVYAFSYVFRLFAHNVLHYNHLILSPNEFNIEKQRAIEQLMESTLLFKRLSETADFDLLIVFYPIKDEIIAGNFEFWDEVILFAERNNINTLNLLDYYLNQLGMNSENVNHYYWQINGHHNSNGYKAFAEGVYNKIKELKIIH
ncbi:MAG: SGNH/GDSL hydrolase family protein [Bacteroidales bacterium]|nr:SGNH/GDSL hydrolase family protein [Bacteroidales bacterium]